MDLGELWSLPSGVSPRLEWGHARELSSRPVAAVSRFPRVDQGYCGFPKRLSHRAVLCATVVSVDPRLESRGSAGKTGFPGID